MTNKFNERVNVLTELLNEGHITENEYLDLVDSLRGGSVNEGSDSVEGVVTGDSITDSTDYDAEINNPNKLDDYEKFLSGDAFTDLHDPAFTDNAKEFEDFFKYKNPLHNTFYHEINSMNGLYKQDLRSGSILQGCSVVEGDGEIKCSHPLTSYEYNKQ